MSGTTVGRRRITMSSPSRAEAPVIVRPAELSILALIEEAGGIAKVGRPAVAPAVAKELVQASLCLSLAVHHLRVAARLEDEEAQPQP